jgi:uncharacterized repeat protein (TIGR02059 family)
MKNAIIIIFLFINLTLSGATYYISPGGSDSNSGSSSAPWKTLAYACSKATASGDIIHVNAGTYLETNQCVLAAGVSIEGVGVTSYIKSHFASTRGGGGISGAAIKLSSSSEGTNGNQSISNIKLDGDNLAGNLDGSVAYVGILVFKRSNVKIHDCTIVNFYTAGIAFHGTNVYSQPTTSYAKGNELYNCTMQNCSSISDINWGGSAVIEIGGQDGLLIHNNILTQTGVTNGYGDVLAGVYYNKGLKYYNNKSYKPDDNNGNWNFHIEMWNVEGGFEIFNNEFHGGDNPIDIAGAFNNKGSYNYSWYIHDNLFYSAPTTVTSKYAIQMEDTYSEDVWIYRNRFTNWPCAINTTNGGSSPTQILKRIYIAYNIFDYEAWTYPDQYQNIFRLRAASGKGDFDGFNIYNNVIKGPTDAYTTAIKIEIESGAKIANLNIKNNIILNHGNSNWLDVDNSGSINGLYINNNILYNNAGNNDPSISGNSVSNYTFTSNLTSNPLFVSSTDFHLQTSSPAIGKGLTLAGQTTDYEGKTLNNPPSIGAYESGSAATAPEIPIYQNSAVANASPTLVEMTYNLTLANIVPAASAFKVLNNSVATTVNAVAVSGTKVQLTLASAIKYGDVVTVSYTVPSSNPLQTVASGKASSISNQSIVNNLINPTKDGVPGVITLAITPNHIHRTININLQYSSTFSAQNPAMSPQIIRVLNLSGKLLIEKLVVTGISNIKIPINLHSGVYNVLILSGGLQMASQKIVVY